MGSRRSATRSEVLPRVGGEIGGVVLGPVRILLGRMGDPLMFIVKPLPFVTTFVEGINQAMEAHTPGGGLSRIQRAWLSFCILAVLVTNSVCWAKFERASIGTYSLAALSWMFRHAKIDWEQLLAMSVKSLLDRYGIQKGYLILDDTDKKRSKSTRKIA